MHDVSDDFAIIYDIDSEQRARDAVEQTELVASLIAKWLRTDNERSERNSA